MKKDSLWQVAIPEIKKYWSYIFDLLPFAITVLDKNFMILEANQSTLNLLGLPKKEVIGKPCYTLFHLTTAPPAKCPYKRMLETSNFKKTEQEMEALNGRKFKITIIPLLNEKGKLFRVVHVAEEITLYERTLAALKYRLQIEEALAQVSTLLIAKGETELKTVLGIMAKPINVTRAFIFQAQGDKGSKIAEWCASDVLPLIDKLQNLDPKQFPWWMKRFRQNKEIVITDVSTLPPEAKAERELLEKYGVKSLLAVPIYAQNQLIGVLGFDDIRKPRKWSEEDIKLLKTAASILGSFIEQKQMQEALKKSEQRYHELVESSPDIIYSHDLEGRYTSINKAITEILGYSKEEFLTKRMEDVIEPAYLSLAKEKIKEKLEGKAEITTYELLCRKKTGEPVWLEVISRLKKENGKPVGIMGFARDVTQRKRIEQELIKTQKLKSLATLAGGIAHDFNNILAVLLSNISLAKYHVQNDPKVRVYLEKAEKACQRAKGLTHQLLTFAKGGVPVKKLMVISEFLKETVNLCLHGSNIKAKFEIADNLWPVEIDPDQIYQVIANLVINAKEAMPEGGILNIKAENVVLSDKKTVPNLMPGKYVKISFIDQGPGIPSHLLDRIFDPYFTTKPKGSGLGLAIVYSIIQKHKGAITVSSVLGMGSTFVIYLPAKEKPLKKRVEHKGEIRKRTAKILIMDDEEEIRKVLSEMLKILGYKIVAAKDGREVFRLYKLAKEKKEPFDLVIMDLTVPGGMGGKEAIRLLQEYDPQVKAIVSSGYSTDPVFEKYQAYGFKGILKKPYRLEELDEVIKEVLAKEE